MVSSGNAAARQGTPGRSRDAERLGIEGVQDSGIKSLGQRRRELPRADQRVTQLAHQDRQAGLAAEGDLAGGRSEEGRGEGVHVAAHAGLVGTVEQLGGHIVGRSEQVRYGGQSQVGAGFLDDPEIRELDLAVRVSMTLLGLMSR